jgi:hypothetical protein
MSEPKAPIRPKQAPIHGVHVATIAAHHRRVHVHADCYPRPDHPRTVQVSVELPDGGLKFVAAMIPSEARGLITALRSALSMLETAPTRPAEGR